LASTVEYSRVTDKRGEEDFCGEPVQIADFCGEVRKSGAKPWIRSR
jgi:hypothetical protein